MHLICRSGAASRDRSSREKQDQQAAAELLTDRNDDSQNSHGDVVADEVVITAS